MWGIVLAWALVRLIVLPRPATESDATSPSIPERRKGRRAGKEHAPPEAAQQNGRGREATSPADIPAPGWKDIFWRTVREFQNDRILAVAAGVTYYTLLALFPAIAALVSIYGLFGDPVTIETHLDALALVLPSGALDIVRNQIQRIASQSGGSLGFGFAAGLAISLWSANAAMKGIFEALNVVYDEKEKRSFLVLTAQSLMFTLGALAFIIASLLGIVVLPVMLSFVGLGEQAEWLLGVLRWPILLTVLVLGLSVLYRYGPSRRDAKWRWITPGGVIAAALWLAGSMLFSWYVSNFANYNETYGSLGAIIGFMTWIWLSSIAVLLGAEIDAEMEHQTARDSTRSPTEPLGQRGATMADRIGKKA